MSKIVETERWRAELLLAEDFRNKEFGEYTEKSITRTGENIDYYEQGFSTGYADVDEDTSTTLNLFHALVKNVVPALYFKNPRIMAFPRRKVDQDASVFAAEILNNIYKTIDVDKHNRKIIFDAYLLGQGIYKVGYATKFGVDIPDEETKKKSTKDRVLESIGLKKPKDVVPVRPEVNKEIIAESPYVQWISPFNFLVDPRASCLEDASWVAHVVEKTVDKIKKNPKFKNTKDLIGVPPENRTDVHLQIPPNHIEAFRVAKLYEIHYREDDGYYLLYIVKDGTEFKELYHEKSVYKMDDWQFGVLSFGGHTHKLYTRSDMTKIKSLQDRITSTFDNILAQVDAFVPKIGVDQTKLSTQSKVTLEDGDVGAIVYTDGDPATTFQEIALTQLKSDLAAFIERTIDMITIQTGITKAQLIGVATGETATAETIAQGGQTLRLQDMSTEIQKFVNKQAEKLWKIIRQFVDLPTLELITGQSGTDPNTGMPIYTWLPEISPDIDQRLQTGMFRFDMEVGSTRQANTELIIKRIQDLLTVLGRTDIIALMQQQGKKVDLAELLRVLLLQMPEVVKDIGRIIQDVNVNSQGTLPPELAQQILGGGGKGGFTPGSQQNQMQSMMGAPSNQASLQREAAQT